MNEESSPGETRNFQWKLFQSRPANGVSGVRRKSVKRIDFPPGPPVGISLATHKSDQHHFSLFVSRCCFIVNMNARNRYCSEFSNLTFAIFLFSETLDSLKFRIRDFFQIFSKVSMLLMHFPVDFFPKLWKPSNLKKLFKLLISPQKNNSQLFNWFEKPLHAETFHSRSAREGSSIVQN